MKLLLSKSGITIKGLELNIYRSDTEWTRPLRVNGVCVCTVFICMCILQQDQYKLFQHSEHIDTHTHTQWHCEVSTGFPANPVSMTTHRSFSSSSSSSWLHLQLWWEQLQSCSLSWEGCNGAHDHQWLVLLQVKMKRVTMCWIENVGHSRRWLWWWEQERICVTACTENFLVCRENL